MTYDFSSALNSDLIEILMTGPLMGSYRRILIRPIESKNTLFYQITKLSETKSFHSNFNQTDILPELISLSKDFSNILVRGRNEDVHLVRLGQKFKSSKLPPSKKISAASHNIQKSGSFQAGVFYPFLHELGFVDKNGTPYIGKSGKLTQINKFIEIFKSHDSGSLKTIVDMGCGSAYLTFALYHVLSVFEKREVFLIGVDFNEDLIQKNTLLAKKLGYKNLSFIKSTIADYSFQDADAVISLHACNTATDDVLSQAVKNKVKLILSAPCCHQEFFQKIKSSPMQSVLKYGLIKEKLSALLTDVYRTLVLNQYSYKTQIIEFVDYEHTPKNMLIKAILTDNRASDFAISERSKFRDFWGLRDLYLDSLL